MRLVQKTSEPERASADEHRNVTMRNIATVPFSQLYDILRSASPEQIAAWARELEQLPEGPRRAAAVTSFYKSLIQVEPAAAIRAIHDAQNLGVRDAAIEALLKTAPESIWGDIAEMFLHLRKPVNVNSREDVIWRWSTVDPVAASQFIEAHPDQDEKGEDDRLFSLLANWGEIDPAAAKAWLEADVARQTGDAFRAFVCARASADRAAAIDYAVANAGRANFDEALKDLAYYLFPKNPDDTRALVLRLPPAQARLAVENIMSKTTSIILHAPEGYQRPPEEAARWVVALPSELWSDGIGAVVNGWMRDDPDEAVSWMNQLPAATRDAALADMCRTSWPEDAAKAVALGMTISDRKLRDEAVGEFARKLGQNRAEALERLEQLQLSHEQKAYLRKIMPAEVHARKD